MRSLVILMWNNYHYMFAVFPDCANIRNTVSLSSFSALMLLVGYMYA